MSANSVCNSTVTIDFNSYLTTNNFTVTLSPGQWCYFNLYNALNSDYDSEAIVTWNSWTNSNSNIKVYGNNDTTIAPLFNPSSSKSFQLYRYYNLFNNGTYQILIHE